MTIVPFLRSPWLYDHLPLSLFFPACPFLLSKPQGGSPQTPFPPAGSEGPQNCSASLAGRWCVCSAHSRNPASSHLSSAHICPHRLELTPGPSDLGLKTCAFFLLQICLLLMPDNSFGGRGALYQIITDQEAGIPGEWSEKEPSGEVVGLGQRLVFSRWS